MASARAPAQFHFSLLYNAGSRPRGWFHPQWAALSSLISLIVCEGHAIKKLPKAPLCFREGRFLLWVRENPEASERVRAERERETDWRQPGLPAREAKEWERIVEMARGRE